MKIADFLFLTMNSTNNSNNDSKSFLNLNDIRLTRNRNCFKSSTAIPHENESQSDEGFWVDSSSKSISNNNSSKNSPHNNNNNNRTSLLAQTISNNLSNISPEQRMRRVKSTPNLLQIPITSSRSRKKSDDSALGSAEESELISDKLSGSITDISGDKCEESSMVSEFRVDEKEMSVSRVGFRLLRPPSVVVSDHDLCPEGEISFITLDEIDAEYKASESNRRRLSDCSTCSSLSFNELDYSFSTSPQEEEEELEDNTKKVSRWKTVKHIFHQLTPFILTYKNSKYPWVQLAGHQGNFKPGEQQGTILKKFCEREKEAFEQLMEDSLKTFVPQYYRTVQDDSENFEYIQLQDLLSQFDNPCVMDCKVGVRTYLEEELLKAKEKPKLRKDMYEKMCQIDPSAPTPEEHQLHGVTKPRYMVWRETISTTSSHGFRIEGVRRSDGFSSKDFKTTRSDSDVKDAFASFVKGFKHAPSMYLTRLNELRAALKQSKFFATHEIIGSSLLFLHDEKKASVWMIDFAKTVLIPEGVPPITHEKPWSVGNHEDGYLVGLSHLINIFIQLSTENS